MTKWLLGACALLLAGCVTTRDNRSREFQEVAGAEVPVMPEYDVDDLEQEADYDARAETELAERGGDAVEPFDEEEIFGPRTE